MWLTVFVPIPRGGSSKEEVDEEQTDCNLQSSIGYYNCNKDMEEVKDYKVCTEDM